MGTGLSGVSLPRRGRRGGAVQGSAQAEWHWDSPGREVDMLSNAGTRLKREDHVSS